MTETKVRIESSSKRTAAPGDGERLRWGILGSGFIAKQFAAALGMSKTGRLVALASWEPLAEPVPEFGEAHIHVDYDALLADPQINAVYIATPHPTHSEWAIKAAEAGKHVLCEKPIGMNAAEASVILDAAARNGVFLMEAFMFRSHPQTQKLIELLRSQVIGDVSIIATNYGYQRAYDPECRNYANRLGGGAILDIGCYCTSMSRLVAGVVAGEPVMEPMEIQAIGSLCETGVDDRGAAVMRFPNGIIAHACISINMIQDNQVRIYGDKGRIEIHSPWFCSGRQGGTSTISVHLTSGEFEEITIETPEWLYAIEADHFARSLAAGEVIWPAANAADTLGNMKVLDAWRRTIGLEYETEKQGGHPLTFAGRKLVRPAETTMPVQDIPEVGKTMSKIAIGCMGFRTLPDAAAVYDAFVEAGGTVFDTAYVYAQGLADKLLGQWLSDRGVREEIVIIEKGAHPPYTHPKDLRWQLEESLERLQTDYVDIYFLHRDDPKIPIGEWVDAMDELRRDGMVRIYGGSNWTTARMDEANAYAKNHGRDPFRVLSNHFSLAEMNEPMWPGCIASSDADSIQWLVDRQVLLFAWSSQARGFFTDRADPGKEVDPVFAKCWYTDENFARRDRAKELAAKHKTDLPTIALAYVLAQKFPVSPIIGPVTIGELRSSLAALDVRLSPQEVDWLRTGK